MTKDTESQECTPEQANASNPGCHPSCVGALLANALVVLFAAIVGFVDGAPETPSISWTDVETKHGFEGAMLAVQTLLSLYAVGPFLIPIVISVIGAVIGVTVVAVRRARKANKRVGSG